MTTNFWRGRSVFVTGGSGLIGNWLIPTLSRAGAFVVALARDGSLRSETRQSEWPPEVTRVRGTVTNYDLIQNVLSTYSIDTVFHLGAQTLVGYANDDPTGTLDTNVRGTWTILEAARSTGGCQVIVASSGKVYGEGSKTPYREYEPMLACHPYDVSKGCADLIATMYAKTYGLPVGIVRCGNVFGGGDLNMSRSVPGIILATLRGEPFVVRSNGRSSRDYLYVEDAVDAYVLLAEGLEQNSALRGEAFNFGLETRITVLDVVEKVLRITGRTDLKPIILGGGHGDTTGQLLDTEKAREVLQWSTRHGIEEGLRKTIAWYRDYLARSPREQTELAV